MMGDDMAIRSGGMYGRPESQYTIAQPTSSMGSFASNASVYGKVAGTALKWYGNMLERDFKDDQLALQSMLLANEKEYNLKNYKQMMADTLASNKMSFYSSGLNINKGTARNVTESNRDAIISDMKHMESQYNIQLEAIQGQRKHNKRTFFVNQVAALF